MHIQCYGQARTRVDCLGGGFGAVAWPSQRASHNGQLRWSQKCGPTRPLAPVPFRPLCWTAINAFYPSRRSTSARSSKWVRVGQPRTAAANIATVTIPV